MKNLKLIFLLSTVVFFTSCSIFQRALAPKFDQFAVAQVKSITHETDSMYTAMSSSNDKSYSTYFYDYVRIDSDLHTLLSYDSSRKHAATVLVIVNDINRRFYDYQNEHKNYVNLNNSQILAYKEGMDAVLNILFRTEANYKP